MKNHETLFDIDKLILLQIALLAADFFLTSNPYYAAHSGLGITTMEFAIHIGWLTVITLILVWYEVIKRGFKWKDTFLILFFIVLLSIQIFKYGNLFSVVFPYFSILGLFFFSRLSKTFIDWTFVSRFIWFLFLLGVILALLRPEVWGVINISFSREYRGEIVFNDMLGISFIASVLLGSYAIFEKKYFIIFLVLILFYSSFGSRRYLLLMLPTLLVVLFFYAKKAFISIRSFIWLAITFFVLFILIYVFGDKVIAFAFSENRGDISTGRTELWAYYWRIFLDHPFLGNGPRIEIPGYLVAQSEVSGALAYLTKFGLFFFLWQIFMVLIALKKAISFLLNSKLNSNETFIPLVVIAGTPLYLIEGIYSVMDPAGMLFWYSVFKIVNDKHYSAKKTENYSKILKN